ncbi:MAG: GNAT family N-acetyltransferase [Firmicutes bacterium]|nr:GNAT family N-acetyltransferase [Bacillota bacterium]
MLRLLEEKDIPEVIRLHTEYIPGALFPKLGASFMTALYKTMIKLDTTSTYVWDEDTEEGGEGVKAFITVTSDSSVLFRQILSRNFLLFLWRSFVYVAGNPMRVGELWETATYSNLADVSGIDAELLFIAIDRNFRKKNISDILVDECLKWLKTKGMFKVKVTTYTTNRGANTLLERLGFGLEKQVPFRNKTLNLYVREFSEV